MMRAEERFWAKVRKSCDPNGCRTCRSKRDRERARARQVEVA